MVMAVVVGVAVVVAVGGISCQVMADDGVVTVVAVMIVVAVMVVWWWWW